MDEIVLILTTVPEGFDSETLARDLVEASLAACVSILPPQVSTYRWQGAVETAQERQLVVKTTSARVSAVRQALEGRHPYEVPEFLVVRADADEAYGRWVATAAAPERGPL